MRLLKFGQLMRGHIIEEDYSPTHQLFKEEWDLTRQLLPHLSVSLQKIPHLEMTVVHGWLLVLELHFEWVASSENRGRAWVVPSIVPCSKPSISLLSQVTME